MLVSFAYSSEKGQESLGLIYPKGTMSGVLYAKDLIHYPRETYGTKKELLDILEWAGCLAKCEITLEEFKNLVNELMLFNKNARIKARLKEGARDI